MVSDSIYQDAENLGSNVSNSFNHAASQVGTFFNNLFTNPSAPTLQTPANAATPTPNQATASTTAIQNQLSREKQIASTSSILTSGEGLEDEPTTTSSILVGT